VNIIDGGFVNNGHIHYSIKVGNINHKINGFVNKIPKFAIKIISQIKVHRGNYGYVCSA